jgi:very-short-patch-repair endonuclease
VGPFVADFYCAKAKLAVEIDGPVHNTLKARDLQRDRWLNTHGVFVLRITNREWIEEPEAVLEAILEICQLQSS